jgi:hypothetical protein
MYLCTWELHTHALLPLVILRENFFHVSTKGKLLDDGSLGGACFDSLQDFPAQGAI